MYVCMYVLYALLHHSSDRHETLGSCLIHSREGYRHIIFHGRGFGGPFRGTFSQRFFERSFVLWDRWGAKKDALKIFFFMGGVLGKRSRAQIYKNLWKLSVGAVGSIEVQKRCTANFFFHGRGFGKVFGGAFSQKFFPSWAGNWGSSWAHFWKDFVKLVRSFHVIPRWRLKEGT